MRKIIDIPNEILQELKILAVKSNKDLKNFIQDELHFRSFANFRRQTKLY